MIPCFGRSPITGKRVGFRHRWSGGSWGEGFCLYCSRSIEQLREDDDRKASPSELRAGPFRRIQSYTFHKGVNCPNDGGRVSMLLECGHTEVRKASKFPIRSKRARCLDCRQGVNR